jgi:hypothetical protein
MKELSIKDLDVRVQYHLQELPNYGDASIYVLTHYQARYPGCVEIRKNLQAYRKQLRSGFKKKFAKTFSKPTATFSRLFFLKRNLPLYLNWMQWFFDHGAGCADWSHYKLWELLEKKKCYDTERFFLQRFEQEKISVSEILFRQAKLKFVEGDYEEASKLAEGLSHEHMYAYEARKIIRQSAIAKSLEENKATKAY